MKSAVLFATSRRRWILTMGAITLTIVLVLFARWFNTSRAEWLSLVPISSPLSKWLAEQSRPPLAGRPASTERRNSLAEAVANTPLTCRELVNVGKMYETRTDDVLATAVIYSGAVDRAVTELPAAGQGTAASKPILAALADTKHIFWRATQQSQSQYFGVMLKVNRCLIDYIAPGRP